MKIKLYIIILLVFSWSCGSKQSESDESMEKSAVVETAQKDESSAMMDSVSSYEQEAPVMSEMAKQEELTMTSQKANINKPAGLIQNQANLADTLYLKNVRLSKKFIKTADLNFKVKSVENVTHKIESLTLKLGGFVQQSAIASNVASEKDITISSDSLMRVTEYYVNNQMIIRVPSIYFDSVLTEISKLHIYLNSRNVKTDDVSTIFLRNKLKGEKRTEYEKRIQKASDQGNRRLDDIVNAERTASELADIAIDKKIENYELQDRIDYSAITLNFYQANSIHKQMVENTLLVQYKPGFWTRAWNAIAGGWEIILNIIIGLLYLWPLYIIAFAVYYLVKYIRKKFKKTE